MPLLVATALLPCGSVLCRAATFSNTTAINFVAGAPVVVPYPSSNVVVGVTGLVTRVSVTLVDLTHPSPDDLDVLLVMGTEFAIEGVPASAQVVFDHVQARLRFQADVFWAKASIEPQVLHLWLDTYQTGKDFTRRGIVEVIVA